MPKSTHSKAFTLIELLVVIAIIALLLAIVMPGLRAAKAKAMQIISAGRMRQIGISMKLYADDNRGFFPETTHGQIISRSWIFTLAPYVGDLDEIRICPADPKRQERLDNHASSFVLNEYIAVPNVDPFGRVLEDFTNLHRLRTPSTTITTFVGADDLSPNTTADHTHSRQWFAMPSGTWDCICADIQPDRYRVGPSTDDKTKGTSNYLYADTRVDSINAQTLKEMADNGLNFARPAR